MIKFSDLFATDSILKLEKPITITVMGFLFGLFFVDYSDAALFFELIIALNLFFHRSMIVYITGTSSKVSISTKAIKN
ncbi:MAG: hypothetical protein QM710_03510 [Flavobacterium sp.]